MYDARRKPKDLTTNAIPQALRFLATLPSAPHISESPRVCIVCDVQSF